MTTDSTLITDKMPQADFTLSANPDVAMQEMMDAIDNLRNVYIEETEALQNVDTMKFLQLQDKKISAARDYQAGVEQIVQRRDQFKDTPPTTREQLKQKQEEFSTLTSANLEALNRMTKTVRRLGDRVMGAARDVAQKDSPNYGSNGNISKNKRTVSISLNESA